ncbi:MAG: hypothetical protein OWQ54_00740 [Sulfolobaceae archaeon]|nr:hypothetical protein [Sulfolobaceae archaeon]
MAVGLITKLDSNKIDYRVLELYETAPNVTIKAFIVFNDKINNGIINNLMTRNVYIIKIYDFLRTIVVKGTVSSIVKLSELPEVNNILLDEILPLSGTS